MQLRENRDHAFGHQRCVWFFDRSDAGQDERRARRAKVCAQAAQDSRSWAGQAQAQHEEEGECAQAPGQRLRSCKGVGSQDEAAAAQMSVKSKDRGTIPILPYGDDYVFRDPNRYPWPFPSAGRESGAVGSSSPGGLTRRPPRRSK